MSQFPTTERKAFKLMIQDGNSQKVIYLTNEEAEKYTRDKNSRKFSFYRDGDEYAMRDCMLRKIKLQATGNRYIYRHPVETYYAMIDGEEKEIRFSVINDPNYKHGLARFVDGKWKGALDVKKVYFHKNQNKYIDVGDIAVYEK